MKYILFNDLGQLVTRYDSEIHGKDIPSEAMEVPDQLFWKTIEETDGQWVLVKGKVTKQPFPPPSQAELDALYLSETTRRRDVEMSAANERIISLQDMVDTDVATAADEDLLKKWKLFRVQLRSLDLTDRALKWPTRPE